MRAVACYDTTLRDGLQTEGLNATVPEQRVIAHAIASLGIGYLEAGFPSSNPRARALIDTLLAEDLADTRLVAFGMTRRRGMDAHADPGLRELISCGTPAVAIVGKTWELHLRRVTKVSPQENLAMIAESVAVAREAGREVIYDAEHFFDAFADDPDGALACLAAAHEAGADWIVCCDTNGGTLPAQVGAAVAEVVRALPDARIGIHTHNDIACAVAASIAAVDAGAQMVHGTINGYGERCGNADLVSCIGALQLGGGYRCIPADRCARLTSVARVVAETFDVPLDPSAPFVGRRAFAHKGGMHSAGVRADTRTFEHIAPERVGNRRRMLVSEQAGRAALAEKASELGFLECPPEVLSRALEAIKQAEHAGADFEGADGSVGVCIARAADTCPELPPMEYALELTGPHTHMARARVRMGPSTFTANGTGPVDALDAAARAALARAGDDLAELRLEHYAVRILDPARASAARTRVHIGFATPRGRFGTTGVSRDVIAASWAALTDAYLFALMQHTLALAR